MRTHRFFVDNQLLVDSTFLLPAQAAHHCAQVLRYQKGQQVILFNGDGYDYRATIESIEKKQCRVKIENKSSPNNESPLQINLFQGVAKGDKMDLIIQKAVELGVSQITPLFSERCNVKLNAKRLEKKINHWKNIIISACEQSGRAIVPILNGPVNISEIDATEDSLIYLDPRNNTPLSSFKEKATIGLLIGPEGGFSEKDLEKLDSLGANAAKLGPRVLRTETAGLSAISVLQSHFGDL